MSDAIKNSGQKSRWQPLPGAGTGFVRSEWEQAFVDAGLRTIEDYLTPQGEALSKPGLGNRYRGRLRLAGVCEEAAVYQKRFGREPFKDRLRRWLEDGRWYSRAERELRVSEALTGLGVRVPQVLAWAKSNGDGTEASAVFLSSVAGQPADQYIARLAEEGHVSTQRLRWLARSMSECARRFHAAGWRHRDFYLCHWFVQETQEGFDLALIDLQRVFRPRWFPERWRIKDLAQLNSSTPPETVSHFSRLRFFRSYLNRSFTHQDRHLLRWIDRKTRTIVNRRSARLKLEKKL